MPPWTAWSPWPSVMVASSSGPVTARGLDVLDRGQVIARRRPIFIWPTSNAASVPRRADAAQHRARLAAGHPAGAKGLDTDPDGTTIDPTTTESRTPPSAPETHLHNQPSERLPLLKQGSKRSPFLPP